MKYVASDILEMTGVENLTEAIGKVDVTIGGVVVNDAKKIINVQDAKAVEVIVGDKAFTVQGLDEQTQECADHVAEVEDERGKAIEKQNEETRARKAEATEGDN